MSTPFDLDPVSPNPVYLQVAAQIRAAVSSRRIQGGAVLPSERELASSLEVSRSSVREAIRILQAEGFLSRSRSGRIVVGDRPQRLRVTLSASPLATYELDDLVEFRGALEAQAVELAAKNPGGQEVDRAEGLLDLMGEPEISAEQFDALNLEFHKTIIAASGNEVMVAVMEFVRNAITGYLPRVLALADSPTGELGRMLEEHRAIVEAIRKGDGLMAASRAKHHIETFYRMIKVDDDE